ncbi:TCR/Tet family MFS transporter [Defluviimonas salinarum]|uniref:TCR/Tet family MFS transporter n=1 Tax=Defluviimonas salinarum TaxID=2992147 RepID=A0ABT3J3Z0_9RHOB|nr:TCR/Tet family MFS transporter [Defluviimonas salinarum]MCW3782385.1 TCR/Tet family MFS transporter [Defluviimonas salinarum]
MQNRLALIFILMTVMIDAIGIGIIFPVMPNLLAEVTGADISHAALWGGVLATSFAVMQFLFGPVVGNLSDRFGRRPVMLTALGVMALDYAIMAVAGTIWLLLVGRVVAGITAATYTTASAYMADISPKEDRAKNFGLIGAAFGLGFIAGPFLGSLLSTLGIRAPFWGAAALSAANLVLGLVVLPESVTDRIRRPFSWARANPLASFRAIGRLPGLGRLLALYLVYNVALHVYESVWAFYGKARFDWDPFMIGVSLAVYGLFFTLVQAFAIGPVIRAVGERRAALYGLWIEFAACLFFAFVTSGSAAIVFTAIAAFGSIAGPAMQGLMSNGTPDDQQGELQGVIASLTAVGMILSPMLMTGTFSWFTRPGAAPYFPGAPFLLAAALVVVCVIILVARSRESAPADPVA